MKRAKRTIAILSLALAGCRGPIVPTSPTPATASLRLLVEHSAAPLLHDLTAAYHPQQTIIAWSIERGDLQTVTDWLRKGETPFALTNYLPADSPLWSTPIGEDGLALVVNAANPVSSLAPEQLRDIFSGRTLNWRELGGADLPITVISRQPGSSDSGLFRALVMGERRVTGAARLATTSEQALSLTAAERGAISYVSMRYVSGVGGVRALPIDSILPTPQTVAERRYPLRSPLLFVGMKAPDDDLYRAFFAWTQSPAGQAIVGKTYAPLAISP